MAFNHKRSLAALGGSVLGLAAAVFIGASPAAADTDLTLQQSQIGSTASGFPSKDDDCGNAPDQDGWHFVAPANANFVTLTVTFDLPGGGTQTTTLDDPAEFGPPDASHAFVLTPAGATLTGGSATVAEDIKQDFFVLSHTCPGTQTESPSPSPSTSTTTSTPPTTTPGVDGTSPAGTQPSLLPKTGAGFPIGSAALFAVLLMAVGGIVLLASQGVIKLPSDGVLRLPHGVTIRLPYRRRH